MSSLVSILFSGGGGARPGQGAGGRRWTRKGRHSTQRRLRGRISRRGGAQPGRGGPGAGHGGGNVARTGRFTARDPHRRAPRGMPLHGLRGARRRPIFFSLSHRAPERRGGGRRARGSSSGRWIWVPLTRPAKARRGRGLPCGPRARFVLSSFTARCGFFASEETRARGGRGAFGAACRG